MRASFEFRPEQIQSNLVRLCVHFDIAGIQISDEAFHAQAFGTSLCKLTITDSLYVAANQIALRSHRVVDYRIF